MKVKCHKNQLDYFRRKARDTQNEIFAYLLGRVTAHTVTIDAFIYPLLEESTPGAIIVGTAETEAVYAAASEFGIQVVGDIHSHPNYVPVMSATDYADHKHFGNAVSGIVEVTNRRTRALFWQIGSALPCTLEYI